MHDEDDTSRVDTPAEMLRERLDGAMPLDDAATELLPEIVARLLREALPVGGQSLGRVLLDPATDLRVIKTIKQYGKKLTTHTTSEAERATATTIYFAAIASALVFHHQKISLHSYEHLHRSFGMLCAKQWMAPELITLFTDARRVCLEERGQSGSRGRTQ